MSVRLYRAATTLAAPAISLLLRRRLAAGKEDPGRIDERRGRPGRPRPEGPLLWVHGASVGESVSALPLIEKLLAEDESRHILVTTGTVTSAGIMSARLPPRGLHQFAPVDRLPWVRRFLDHWRPDAALWMESELWPNIVGETQRRSVPMILVNGRMSLASYRRWQRARWFIRPLLQGFALCLAQTPEDARRLETLGAPNASCPGNLKFAADPLPVDDTALAQLRTAVGQRPVWLAASTHAGEEALIGHAHRALRRAAPDILTILVPRHATRGKEIALLLAQQNLSLACRSADDLPTASTDVYIADTMGEMGLFYRLSEIAFIGGSLVPHGGHNLLEPALLDTAIVHGPHMANFSAVAGDMAAAGGSETVDGADSLAACVERLLHDPGLRRQRSLAAARVAAERRDVLDRVMTAVRPHLPSALRAPCTGRHAGT